MAENSASNFGTYLREAREARGTSLRQIAAATKISVHVLGALEQNDISRLPGGLFSRAFVRAYAREVGLEPERAVEMFLARFPEAAGDSSGEKTERTSSFAEPDRPNRLALGLFGLAATVLLVVAWVVVSNHFFPASHRAGPVTSRSAAGMPARAPAADRQAPALAGPDTTAAAQSVASTGPDSTKVAEQSRAGSQAAATGQPPAVGQAVAAAQAPPDVPGAQAATSGTPAALRISLLATARCWVSATADGTRTFARLLQPGERAEVQADNYILLIVGNAGGLSFTLNGVPGRSLGTPGQVVTERIDRTNYESYVAR
jgi:cytoskeleton protein RodZ